MSRHKLWISIFAYQQYQRFHLCQCWLSETTWCAFPLSIGVPYQLGQRRPGTLGTEISNHPSVRTSGAVIWHVACRLLRRDVERSLWNQLRRFAHYRRHKPFKLTSEEIRVSKLLLLQRMRCQLTFTPDTTFENQRTLREYRIHVYHKRYRRLLR